MPFFGCCCCRLDGGGDQDWAPRVERCGRQPVTGVQHRIARSRAQPAAVAGDPRSLFTAAVFHRRHPRSPRAARPCRRRGGSADAVGTKLLLLFLLLFLVPGRRHRIGALAVGAVVGTPARHSHGRAGVRVGARAPRAVSGGWDPNRVPPALVTTAATANAAAIIDNDDVRTPQVPMCEQDPEAEAAAQSLLEMQVEMIKTPSLPLPKGPTDLVLYSYH